MSKIPTHRSNRARHAAVIAGAVLMVASCTSSASSEPAAEDPDPTAATVAVADAADDAVALRSAGIQTDDDTDGAESADASGDVEASVVPPVTAVPIDDVSNEGVLAAAVIILSDGDLEAAIAEGLVTEAEAEAALLALETDTLSEYADPN